jgi:acyl transferase domain-containing protein
MANGDGRDIVARPGNSPSNVSLTPTATMDLSFLPEAQRNALLADHARKMLDLGAKAQELHVDVNVLRATLDQLATTTRDVSEAGNAVTISHTQTTKIGRTEIKMGNTEEARSGKLSKSQTGERDWNPYYIFAAIAAVVLIAFLFAGRH